MRAACHPEQAGAFDDSSDAISILTSRGCGKTAVLAARLVRKATRKRSAVCLFFGPTRDRAKELVWERLRSICERLQIKARFFEGSQTIVVAKTKSKIIVTGCEKNEHVEKFRGQSFDEVQVDETQLVRESIICNLIDSVIGPRLGDKDGCFVLAGTPGKRRVGRWFELTRADRGAESLHRPYRERESDDYQGWIGWSSHWWSYETAAPHVTAIAKLWAKAQATKARERWTDTNPIWLREYRGIWAEDLTEHIYSAYSSECSWAPEMRRVGTVRIALLPDDILQTGRVLFGLGGDMGHSDPFALNVFAWSPLDPLRRIFHVFAFEKRKIYAQQIAQLLLGVDEVAALKVRKPTDPQGLIGAIGWPAVSAVDTAGSGSAVLGELANVYGVTLAPAEKPGKFSMFEVVNGLFASKRLFLLRGSLLEQEVCSLQWVEKHGQLFEPQGVANHHSDTMVYAVPRIVSMFEADAAPMAPAVQRQPGDAGEPIVKAVVVPPAASPASVFAALIDVDDSIEHGDISGP